MPDILPLADLVFRAADPTGNNRWPAGSARITWNQGDLNLYKIATAINSIGANAAVSLSAVNFTAPNLVTFVLSNGTEFGPFTLPKADSWNPRGAWAAATAYAALDVVYYGASVYLVAVGHTSAGSFSPGATDGLGHNLYELVFTAPSAGSPAVVVNSDATLALTTASAWTHYRMTRSLGAAITLPLNATQAVAVGALVSFSQGGNGALTFAGESVGVTVLVPVGREAATDTKGAVVTARKVDTNTWELSGDLALTTPLRLVPTGGVVGQVLKRTSGGGDPYAWGPDATGGGGGGGGAAIVSGYSPVLGDEGKDFISSNGGFADTFFIDKDVNVNFAVGTKFTVTLGVGGAGSKCTITFDAAVSVVISHLKAPVLANLGDRCELLKIAANTWLVTGDGLQDAVTDLGSISGATAITDTAASIVTMNLTANATLSFPSPPATTRELHLIITASGGGWVLSFGTGLDDSGPFTLTNGKTHTMVFKADGQNRFFEESRLTLAA